MIRSDRRGAGVAEYALLLFLVVAAVGITFRFMGNRVKGAGEKTQEQFQGGGGSGGGGPTAKNGAAGAGSAGGADTAAAGGGGAAGAGGSGGSGGKSGAAGGSGGGGASGGKATSGSGGGGADDQAADENGTPVWKIIGGVIVVLFLIGGYFAFRKQKSSG